VLSAAAVLPALLCSSERPSAWPSAVDHESNTLLLSHNTAWNQNMCPNNVIKTFYIISVLQTDALCVMSLV